MTVTMTLSELKDLCKDMAELGAANYQRLNAPASDLISQAEAWRLYKRQRVERWLEQGLLTTERLGTNANSKRMYSRSELMALDTAERIRPIITDARVIR